MPSPPLCTSGRVMLAVPEMAPALVVTLICVPPTSGLPAGSLATKQNVGEEPPSGTSKGEGGPEHVPSAKGTPTVSCVGPVNSTVVVANMGLLGSHTRFGRSQAALPLLSKNSSNRLFGSNT